MNLKPLLKKVAVTLSLLLIYQSVALPLAEASIFSTRNNFNPKASNFFDDPSVSSSKLPKALLTNKPLKFTIPAPVGEIVESYAPQKAGRVVYHIQDVHSHVPSQTNLAEIINKLSAYASQQDKKVLVAIEGVEGSVDSDTLSAYPDKEIKMAVTDALLKAGYLFGEEHSAINHEPGQIKIIGVEKSSLYEKNDVAEKISEEAREEISVVISEIRKQLEKLKPHNFNTVLSQLERNRLAVERGELGITEYAQYLNGVKPALVNQYPEVKRVLALAEVENTIDFEVLEKETQKLLSDLMENRSEEFVEKLLEDAQALKAGELSPLSYYKGLLKKSNKVAPILKSYVSYLKNSEKTNVDALFDEIAELETKVALNLFKHPLAKELYAHLRWIERQEKFFSLEMIPQEWDRQKDTTLKEIVSRRAQISQFVTEQTSSIGYQFSVPAFPQDELKLAVMGARAYYRAAKARDLALTQNLNRLMKRYSSKNYVVALIAGGFHTPGMTKKLKEMGYAYKVIRPQIETEIELNEQFDIDPIQEEEVEVARLKKSINNKRLAANLVRIGVTPFQKAFGAAQEIREGTIKFEIPKPSQETVNKAKQGSVKSIKAAAFPLLGIAALPAEVRLQVYQGIAGWVGIGIAVVLFAALVGWVIKQLRKPKIDKRVIRSGQVLSELTRNGEVSSKKMAVILSVAAALNLRPVYVESGDENTPLAIENGKLIVPTNWIDEWDEQENKWENVENKRIQLSAVQPNGDTDHLLQVPGGSGGGIIIIPIRNLMPTRWAEAQALLDDAQQEKANARSANLSVADLMDAINDGDTVGRINAKLNDESFQERLVRAHPHIFEPKFPNMPSRIADGKELKRVMDAVPSVFRDNFSLSQVPNPDDASEPYLQIADNATNNLQAILDMVSAVPAGLTKDRVELAKLMSIPDLNRRKGLKENPDRFYVQKDGTPYDDNTPVFHDPLGRTAGTIRDEVAVSKSKIFAAVLAGEIHHRMFFGGAWTRRSESMDPNTPHALATVRDFAESLVRDNAKKTKENLSDDEIAQRTNELVKDVPYPDEAIIDLFIQGIITEIRELAKKHGINPASAIANQQFVLSVGEGPQAKFIEDHLVNINFYGLSPSAFIIVPQRFGPGFGVNDRNEVDHQYPEVEKLEAPYNHYEIELASNRPFNSYFLDYEGKRHYLPASQFRFSASQGASISHHQVSLTSALMKDWRFNEERLSVHLSQVHFGNIEAVAEYVENTQDKGGSAALVDAGRLPDDVKKSLSIPESAVGGRAILVEGNQLKSPEAAEIKDQVLGNLINSAVVTYDPEALERFAQVYNFPLAARVRAQKVKRGDKEYQVNPRIFPEVPSYAGNFNALNSMLVVPGGPEGSEDARFRNRNESKSTADYEKLFALAKEHQTKPGYDQTVREVSAAKGELELAAYTINYQQIYGFGAGILASTILYFAGDIGTALRLTIAAIGFTGVALGFLATTSASISNAQVNTDDVSHSFESLRGQVHPFLLFLAENLAALVSRLPGVRDVRVSQDGIGAAKDGNIYIGLNLLTDTGSFVSFLTKVVLLPVVIVHEASHVVLKQTRSTAFAEFTSTVASVFALVLTPFFLLVSAPAFGIEQLFFPNQLQPAYEAPGYAGNSVRNQVAKQSNNRQINLNKLAALLFQPRQTKRNQGPNVQFLDADAYIDRFGEKAGLDRVLQMVAPLNDKRAQVVAPQTTYVLATQSDEGSARWSELNSVRNTARLRGVTLLVEQATLNSEGQLDVAGSLSKNETISGVLNDDFSNVYVHAPVSADPLLNPVSYANANRVLTYENPQQFGLQLFAFSHYTAAEQVLENLVRTLRSLIPKMDTDPNISDEFLQLMENTIFA